MHKKNFNIFLIAIACFQLLFGQELLAQNTLGKGHLPLFNLYKPEQLSRQICANKTSEEEKVRAIYNWITYHIKYDTKRYSNAEIKRFSNKKTLFRGKALCDEYANLFETMCKAVSIKCITIDGYLKGYDYEPDDTLYAANHAWNMVKIDEHWQLVDITLSAGYLVWKPTFLEYFNPLFFKSTTRSKLKFVFKRDTSFFKADPNRFVASHLPSMAAFQNLEIPIDVYRFQVDSSKRLADVKPINGFNEMAEYWFNATEKEKHLSHADSAIGFNARNQIARAFDLNNAAYQTLVEAGYNPKNKEFPSSLTELQKADALYFQCNESIVLAKALVQEEFQKRKYKNQYRNKLAMQTIKPVLNLNKKTLAFSKKIPIRNKRKISNYAKLKENIGIQKQQLQNRSGALLQSADDSLEEWFLNKSNYNKQQLKVLGDSMLLFGKRIEQNLILMQDTLLPSLNKRINEVYAYEKILIALSQFSNVQRINHQDNLDVGLDAAQYLRLLTNDSLRSGMNERNLNMREFYRLESENRELIGMMKQCFQTMKQIVDENAGIGINNQGIYQAQLNYLLHYFDLLSESHTQIQIYLGNEINWANPMIKLTRKHAKMLEAELVYEEARRKIKQAMFVNKASLYKKLLEELKSSNRKSKTVLKTQIKRLSKLK